MLPERVYRWLLIVHPREHRQEYEELMVQLFRDRLRRDGNGFRGLIFWLRMILDLVGAAFEEHKEGTDMRKLTGIGIVVAVLLIVAGIGAGVLLAQSNDEVIMVFSGIAPGGVAEAVQKAVEDGAIGEEAADEIVQAFEDGDGPADAWRYEFGAEGVAAESLRQAVESGDISQTTADAIVGVVAGRIEGGPAFVSGGKVVVLEDVQTFPGTGPVVVSEALHEALQAGATAQGAAGEVVLSSSTGDGPPSVRRYAVGEDGVAGAVQQAVKDGVISQALADLILRSFDGGNTGS